MAARFGIELSPTACRVIAIDAPAAWSRRRSETLVRSFALLPASGSETRTALRALRRKTAAVVAWTASEHRQVVVTGGSYESMRAEALDALAAAGLQTQGVVADIAPVVGPPRRGVRQPVVVSLTPAAELSAQLQPLREAAIRLRAVTTPAVALASLARVRRDFSVSNAIEAYVALEHSATCIALVRNADLIAARNLAWGYGEERPTGRVTRPRAEIAERLGDAVTEFVAAIGAEPREIGQVCVCGGLPELRSMTAPLMERLDVEVEPLDSMFGIDVAHPPEPADEFRERLAELRLAWVVAADWPPPINLLRARRRQASKRMLSRVAVAAGVVAGVTAGWRVEQSQWWQSTTAKPMARSTPNFRPAPASVSRPAPPPNVGPSRPPPPDVGPTRPAAPAVAQTRPPVVAAPPPVAQTRPPVVPPDLGPTRPPPAPASSATERPLRPAPPPTRVEPPSTRAERPPTRVEPPPARVAPPPTRIEPPPARTEPTARVEPSATSVERVPSPAPAPSRSRPASPPETALPFDAVLGTILYSPDRRLAIVDGRIVGPGDEVRGARVIDITPTAVMLRDSQGRLRRLALAEDR